MKKINVGIAGLGFGSAFVEIYKYHPSIGNIVIYDPKKEVTDRVSLAYGIDGRADSFDALLADKSLDAVHLISPIPDHEEQTLKVLRSGKHCACTVPMATSLDGIRKIVDTVRETGKKYMMMETCLYTYQFLYVQEMLAAGEMGKLQFLRGSHYQDMENWPDYWMGLPPMYYGTHAVSPLVTLSGSRAEKVVAAGSGTMREELKRRYNNPYPIESGLIFFENGMKAEATRSLFETARVYQEGLFVYGSKRSFEWGFADGDKPYLTTLCEQTEGKRGSRLEYETVTLPNYHERLPKEIQRFTVGSKFDPLNPQDSLKTGTGGGHHGSHPHLVHEFISSIIENRKPRIDEELAANITAAGICMHESAISGGMTVKVPKF